MWTVSPELDAQVQLILSQALVQLAEARARAAREIENDLASRGVLRSGGFVAKVTDRNVELVHTHLERAAQDILEMVETYDELNDNSAAWIRDKITAHALSLAMGLTTGITERARTLGILSLDQHIREEVDRGLASAASKVNRSVAMALGRAKLKAKRTAVHATSWPKVDRALAEITSRLGSATTEEQLQAVGHLCGQALISLGESAHDPKRHPIADGVNVSPTDAKRRLEAVIATELQGQSAKEERSFARTAIDFAHDAVKFAENVKHDRNADRRAAAICAEATAFLVRLMQIITT